MEESYKYDTVNRRISEKRRINDTTKQNYAYAYDGAGYLAQVRQRAHEEECSRREAVTSYEYDYNGNLLRVRLPYGGEVCMEYDTTDRLAAETHVEKATGILGKPRRKRHRLAQAANTALIIRSLKWRAILHR